MDTEVKELENVEATEVKKQKVEVKKQKEVISKKIALVQYLKDSNYAGRTEELPISFAKKMEATGKVRIIKIS